MTERLTTLAAVKDWLEIDQSQVSSGDAGLIRVIDAASQFILNWLSRESFQLRSYTDNFRGNGKTRQILRNWPVVSITSVGTAGNLISASTPGVAGMPGPGYVLSDARNSPQSVELYGGYYFYYNLPSQVVYTAGYQTTQLTTLVKIVDDEGTDTIQPFSPNQLGQWTLNVSVTLNGAPAVLVTEDPTAGQYTVDEWGTYGFAVVDEGKEAAITYCYAPWDISFAATQLVGEWYKSKERIGLLSKTLGGQETITFSVKDMSDMIRSQLQPYQDVLP